MVSFWRPSESSFALMTDGDDYGVSGNAAQKKKKIPRSPLGTGLSVRRCQRKAKTEKVNVGANLDVDSQANWQPGGRRWRGEMTKREGKDEKKHHETTSASTFLPTYSQLPGSSDYFGCAGIHWWRAGLLNAFAISCEEWGMLYTRVLDWQEDPLEQLIDWSLHLY